MESITTDEAGTAPNQLPDAPPAPEIDPNGSVAQLVGVRQWTENEGRKLCRALVKIGSVHDDEREALAGVHIRAGHAIATDGHRLLVALDYCKAEHLQGFTYRTLGSGFGLFGEAVADGEFPEWESLLPRLSDVSHTLELSFSSFPKVSEHTPLAIKKDGLVLGGDLEALAIIDARYLSALPRTDAKVRLYITSRSAPVFVCPEGGGWFALLMPMSEAANLIAETQPKLG